MFKLLIIGSLTLYASIFRASVNAADICAYTSRSCIGSFGCCSNVPAGTCCQWLGTNYGWSVKFQNMPAGWFGTTYGDLCHTSTSGVGGTGSTACQFSQTFLCEPHYADFTILDFLGSSVFNAPTYSNWQSANWIVQAAARRSAKFDVPTAQDTTACAIPDVVGFTTPDGQEHLIKVPEGKFAEVSEHVAIDNYEELLKLERAGRE